MVRSFPRKTITLALLCGLSAPAFSHEAGDWLLRVGGGWVSTNTSSDNLVFEGMELDGFQIDVDNGASAIFNLTYFMSPNLGVELLAATPFSHDIDGSGALEPLGKIGEIKHLPPVLSLQYHFRPNASVRPYVGAGANFTLIFDEETGPVLHEGIVGTANGALGTSLSGGETTLAIDNSFGVALQAGLDIDLTESMFFNIDLRWIDIEADASLRSETFDPADAPVRFDSTISVDIDPWVLSGAVGWKF